MSGDPEEDQDALNPKSRGLGRGLSALFEEDEDVLDQDSAGGTIGSNREYLPIEKLKPGQFQPRKDFTPKALEELTESIKKHGVLQPLLVRIIENESYEIIAGERRWRAAQQAGAHEIPVVIKDFDHSTTLEVALIENLQREDLNPLEEADAYQRLMSEFDHTQETLAAAMGKSRSHVANTLRLTNLPDAVKTFVLAGKLSAGHARTLIGAADPVAVAEKIIAGDLSVRAAEKLAQESKGKTSKTNSSQSSGTGAAKGVDTLALEKEVSDRLGTRVEINAKDQGKGQLIIHYNDLDQLDDFLHRLSQPRK